MSSDNWRRLPPIRTISPPPAKRQKSESTPLSESGHSRYYSHSASVPTSDRSTSRHASAAMDIYSITNRDPIDRDRERAWERQRSRQREQERDERERERNHERLLEMQYDAEQRRARLASNGSAISHSSALSRGSHSSPPIIVAERKTTDAPLEFPEKHPLVEENGRKYHGYAKGKYFLPCDDEEQDRLDIFHQLFNVARGNECLINVPHKENAKILDLGCGTGIWCIDVATKLPSAHVVGVDLAPMQPTDHPKNVDFYAPFDFDGLWSLGEDSWDLIHMRMGCGSVTSWQSLYKRAIQHLKPGAWFEQVEIDFEPRSDDRDLTKSALGVWYKNLKGCTEQANKPIAHDFRKTIKDLQEAGFTEIEHQVIGLPMNPWHNNDHENQVARWYNLAISESIEPLSLAPFTRVAKWNLHDIRQNGQKVKGEAFDRKNRCYNIMHIYQAQKPHTK